MHTRTAPIVTNQHYHCNCSRDKVSKICKINTGQVMLRRAHKQKFSLKLKNWSIVLNGGQLTVKL